DAPSLSQDVGEVLECPVMQVLRDPLAFCLPDLSESLFGTLALGDVLDNGDEVLGFTPTLPHERNGEVDPDDRAVLLYVAFLHRVGLYISDQKLVDLLEVGLE